MADLRTNLAELSERGTHRGAEELIERIETELTYGPIPVVGRDEEASSTRRGLGDHRHQRPSLRRLVTATMALAVIVAVGVLAMVELAPGRDAVSDGSTATTTQTSPTTTAAVDAVADPTYTEIIQDGLDAWSSGDIDAVLERFDVPSMGSGWTEPAVAADVEYQQAVHAEYGATCEGARPGEEFGCTVIYSNDLTRPLGAAPLDTVTVSVVDGVIHGMDMPSHKWISEAVGVYLASIGEYDGYGPCFNGAVDAECAEIQLGVLDEWAPWMRGMDAETTMQQFVDAVSAGDCNLAPLMLGLDHGCTDPGLYDYEAMMHANAHVDGCEPVDGDTFRCIIEYSNDISEAVAASPTPTQRTVSLEPAHLDAMPLSLHDRALYDSFEEYLSEQSLSEEYARACGIAGISWSADCAEFTLAHLDDWAAWYHG